jgi:exoribonuclease II
MNRTPTARRADSTTWVRVFTPPVEGRLVDRAPDPELGECVRVKPVATDVERGFIDFVRLD